MNLPTSIFDHDFHVAEHGDKWSCVECHDSAQPKGPEGAKGCYECHQEDMGPESPQDSTFVFLARSHVDAMHDLCVTCHQERDEKEGRLRDGECAFCHGPAAPQPAESIGKGLDSSERTEQ
jgi:hypothetical protein